MLSNSRQYAPQRGRWSRGASYSEARGKPQCQNATLAGTRVAELVVSAVPVLGWSVVGPGAILLSCRDMGLFCPPDAGHGKKDPRGEVLRSCQDRPTC